jgi:hypothetical protein
MKDQRGYFYYPFPENRRVRMYVREAGGDICFRMWNADDERMWEEHGWVPYTAIREATALYARSEKGFDPRRAYDPDAARVLIEEERANR